MTFTEVKGEEVGRTPQGVRGLKQRTNARKNFQDRRTPQGVRGLKREVFMAGTGRRAVALRKECVD